METTATQKFIEDAIKGGWKEYETGNNTVSYYTNTVSYYTNTVVRFKILLDPLAWQAVGKTRGWDKEITFYNRFTDGKEDNEPWRLHSHRFIDHLADGDSVEEALSKLQ